MSIVSIDTLSLRSLAEANAYARNLTRLRELLRVREALSDNFYFDNFYQSTPESWQRYFGSFLVAARGKR